MLTALQRGWSFGGFRKSSACFSGLGGGGDGGMGALKGSLFAEALARAKLIYSGPSQAHTLLCSSAALSASWRYRDGGHFRHVHGCEQDWLKHFDVLPGLFPSGFYRSLRNPGPRRLLLELSSSCEPATMARQNARLQTNLYSEKGSKFQLPKNALASQEKRRVKTPRRPSAP